jgi:hypothetical protein
MRSVAPEITLTENADASTVLSSPFPPIADYAFLSNCHTGALVAPDGAVDWLCVPRFDSPSVFASLLDREAGFFRFAPFGINHPTARAYEPGTNVLVTTWKTPTGWIVVRDALTMGTSQQEDRVTPHTRPPADAAYRLMLFTGDPLPGFAGRSMGVEPMTCPPNAFRTGEALIALEPGASWTGEWGIAGVTAESPGSGRSP